MNASATARDSSVLLVEAAHLPADVVLLPMVPRLSRSLALALVLIAGALMAGCGGGGKSTSNSRSTGTGAPTSPGSKNVKQALEDCKREVQSQSRLSANAKAKLESACEKAARGEVSSVRRIAEEVCKEVINGSGLKAGPAKERALAACSSAKK